MKLTKPLNVVRPAIREAIRPAIRPAFAGVDIGRQCYAYNFDGIDDRGVLQSRAINPDGDILIKWSQFGVSPRVYSHAICSQQISTSVSAREFLLAISPTGQIVLQLGGPTLTLGSGNNDDGRYEFSLVGSSLLLIKNGTTVINTTFNRGAAREPTARTVICAFSAGNLTSFSNFALGKFFDFEINGTLWPMAERNQAIQPSIPAGNNMTLVNTTSDRWEEIACSLRVTP